MRRFAVVAALILAACPQSPDGADACSRNDDCEAGEACVDGSCWLLCEIDDHCGPNDCDGGRICVDHICRPGCRDAIPQILFLDGDGSEDGGTDVRGATAEHHVRNELRVVGEHLTGAYATLLSPSGPTVALAVVSSTSQSLVATLPSSVVEGLHSLRVANSIGSDQVDVWVLQGEQGPPGEPQTGSATLLLLQGLGNPVPGLHAETARSATTAGSATTAEALTDTGGNGHPYEELATPPGAVMHFALEDCPAGWIKANGAIAARASFPALYAAIGDTFGAGDGSTTFGLPDLRGEFVRGLDDGRGVDTDRGLGTGQAHDWKTFSAAGFGNGTYTHGDVWIPKSGYNTTYPFGGYWSAPGNLLRFRWDTTSEIRPRNIALLACIKI